MDALVARSVNTGADESMESRTDFVTSSATTAHACILFLAALKGSKVNTASIKVSQVFGVHEKYWFLESTFLESPLFLEEGVNEDEVEAGVDEREEDEVEALGFMVVAARSVPVELLEVVRALLG